MSESGLIVRYNNETMFALQSRMIISLAFIPINDLDEVFELLSDNTPDELIPVLNWFEDTYLGKNFYLTIEI